MEGFLDNKVNTLKSFIETDVIIKCDNEMVIVWMSLSMNGITMKGLIDENYSIWWSLVDIRHNIKVLVDTNIRILKGLGDENNTKG